MRVLVTGGSGVVGEAAVQALLRHGHAVRLLSRHAADDGRAWPASVEPWPGDVTRPETLVGSADGCDAVLHCVGIVAETEPALTFERVNVEGTRHVVAEAARAHVPRLVYVSSLGADRGTSPYHRSKLAGEEIVRGFPGRWLVVRPGNVYGPGDEVISLLLRMVRTLPVVPVIAGGDQQFEPVWAGDLGEALARAVARVELAGEALDVAGPERTSTHDLLDRFAQLTGSYPVRLPVPGALASLGLEVADAVGLEVPIDQGQLTMLAEGNLLDHPSSNALTRVLGVEPTSLDQGLRMLLDGLPEQLPGEGVGAMQRKRFWADIEGARRTPEALLHVLCAHFQEVTPRCMNCEAEPGTPTSVLGEGQTLTMALPMRGTVQVRVASLEPCALTLQTVEGHPLAGAVRFFVESRQGADARVAAGVRFTIEVLDRAATTFDWIAMAIVGGRMQNATWHEFVEQVVRESGGTAPVGVQEESMTLAKEDAIRVDEWLRALAMRRRRADHEAPARTGRASCPTVREAERTEPASAARLLRCEPVPSQSTGVLQRGTQR